jgi:putative DNA primase/helicase
MRQDFFEFTPTHKIVIVGNHRPALRNVDEAMRRRLLLIPFDAVIPPEARDPQLAEKLALERPAILGWMLAGCRAWLERGLDPPRRVLAATKDYFESADAIARWVEECCVIQPNAYMTKKAAFDKWKEWAEASNEFVGTKHRLGDRLRQVTGVDEAQIGESRAHSWIGIGLRADRG